MVVTINTNLNDPQMLADSVMGGLADLPVLARTGAAQIVTGMPQGVVGSTVTVPYFGTLGAFEVISDGTPLEPVQLTSSDQSATLVRVGQAVELSVWAQNNGQDPVTEVTRQIFDGLVRAIDKQLLTVAQAGPWSLSYDGYSAGAGTFTYDSLVEALSLFGDETDDISAVVVSSKVAKDIRLLKDTVGRPLFGEGNPSNGILPTVLGIPLVVSDTIKAVSDGYGVTIYKNLILKRNSLVAWMADITENSIETQRNILTHTDVFSLNAYAAFHRYTRLAGLSKAGVVHLKTK
jgi:hypothetical protein